MDVIFTTDDVKTFQDMVSNCAFDLGEGSKQTSRTRGNHTVEVSFDRKGKHLALVEMVAHRDYGHIEAPIEAIVTRRYYMSDRHGEYILKSEIIRKIENK
tara:strand:+ start:773 stop:1072 length:300 start_codon:yes stop_codon:yes gene_type:complete